MRLTSLTCSQSEQIQRHCQPLRCSYLHRIGISTQQEVHLACDQCAASRHKIMVWLSVALDLCFFIPTALWVAEMAHLRQAHLSLIAVQLRQGKAA